MPDCPCIRFEEVPLKLVTCKLNTNYMPHPLFSTYTHWWSRDRITPQYNSHWEMRQHGRTQLKSHRTDVATFLAWNFIILPGSIYSLFAVALDSVLWECLPFLFSSLTISIKDDRDYKEHFFGIIIYYYYSFLLRWEPLTWDPSLSKI